MKCLSSKALYIIITLSILIWMVLPISFAVAKPALSTKTEAAVMAAKKPIIASSSIGAVTVTGQTYFELEKVEVLDSDVGETNIFLTVSLHNYEVKDLFLRDYWIYLLPAGKSQMAMKLALKDQKKNRVVS